MKDLGNRPYISGPMSGIPDNNEKLFNEVAVALKSQGSNPINPVVPGSELRKELGREPTYEEYMQRDLEWVLSEATSVILLPGWKKSSGAIRDRSFARKLGLPIYELWVLTFLCKAKKYFFQFFSKESCILSVGVCENGMFTLRERG